MELAELHAEHLRVCHDFYKTDAKNAAVLAKLRRMESILFRNDIKFKRTTSNLSAT